MTPADRYQSLFEQAPFSMQLLAPSGRTLRVNAAWKKLWGIDGAGLDFVLTTYNILEDPQLEKKGIAGHLRRAFAGETVEIPAIAYDPNEIGIPGRSRWVSAHAHPIRDEQERIVEVMLIHQDVTERVRVESELSAGEERLRLATEAGNIGIWEWRVQDDRVTWSDRVYALHGLEPGTFGGTLAAFEALVHPEDLPGLRDKIGAAVAASDTFSADFRVVLREGGERWLTTWARLHRAADGTPERMIGATVSVDTYKRAEAALREGDRRKDEFLAMLAHELRNPMAPIQNAAELLAHSRGDASLAAQAGEIISRQVRHMSKLIDDLLDVSRVTRGLVTLDRAPVELAQVIGAAAEQARPVIDARRHALVVDVAAAPAWVSGDRTRLVQVVANLLDNAAKYTPPHGQIRVSLQRAGDHAVIAVSDNGQGIEPDLKPRVFDLFTQGPRPPDRSQGGLGIGLSLVRSLVELHGGTIDAQSAGKDRGSVFTLRLSLLAEGLVPRPRPSGSLAAPAHGIAMRVVVVDDNRDAAAAVANLLRAHGCDVTQYADAEAVLAQPAPSADAFIIDLGLPGMDGFDLVRALRRQPERITSRFVALSGYGQPQDVLRAEAAGFDAHLVKPAQIEQILAAIGRHAG